MSRPVLALALAVAVPHLFTPRAGPQPNVQGRVGTGAHVQLRSQAAGLAALVGPALVVHPFLALSMCFALWQACQGLELAGCGGVQGCFGALATSNARLDLVVSRDEASGALMMVASSLALEKIMNFERGLAQ